MIELKPAIYKPDINVQTRVNRTFFNYGSRSENNRQQNRINTFIICSLENKKLSALHLEFNLILLPVSVA